MKCPYCGKWQYLPTNPLNTTVTNPSHGMGTFTWTLATTTNTTAGSFAPLSPEFYCQGHRFVPCQDCGWNVPEGYHDEADCARLSLVMGKNAPPLSESPGKTAVPKAFYDALKDEG